MFKKYISILLALVLVLGTSTMALAEESDLLARIQQRGTIIVATEGAWAPWTYHDESDQLVGFDVEVARAIAAKLGVEAEFIETEWDGI
ncbi:MAG: transporter substrate-binding domain-containing protein, partial [Clostridia bacterium]|nr:transporter substrate-binding domain-containing protein [Clostridia bacterium]